jgi:hypothetical protein
MAFSAEKRTTTIGPQAASTGRKTGKIALRKYFRHDNPADYFGALHGARSAP